MLKDDTLGLGAKRNNGDECTGLDAFQHLLGRLNGKSDETLETERKVREDLKLSLYLERKMGTIRFVKGGWLVGDQLKDTPVEDATEPQSSAVSDASAEIPEPAAEKSKKRKADQDADREDEKARRKEKKTKKRKTDSDADMDSEDAGTKKESKKSKKRRAESEYADEGTSASSKGSKSKKDRKGLTDNSTPSSNTPILEADEVDGSADAKETKKERKAKKDKKDKKEKRKKDKAGATSEAELGDSISKEKKRRRDSGTTEETTPPTLPAANSGASTPSGSGYSTPVPTGSSRYLARSRFIAQKRMAFTDTAALNQVRVWTQALFDEGVANTSQIFMIKS